MILTKIENGSFWEEGGYVSIYLFIYLKIIEVILINKINKF